MLYTTYTDYHGAAMLVGPKAIAQRAMALRRHCPVLYSNDIYVYNTFLL